MTGTIGASASAAVAGRTGRELIAGVDVGGTKIAVIVTDGAGRAVLGRSVHPTVVDAAKAPDAIVAVVSEALAGAGGSLADLAAVGVGVPGRVDPGTGQVRLAVNLGWPDVALRDALEARIGAPCAIENDVRAAALGLYRRRAMATAEPGDLAYLAVGTGVAAGVVLDGRLHRGGRGLAGEIGHAIAEPGGASCACGQAGCLEALVSGPAIARRARAAVAAGEATTLGPEATATQVFDAARAGDALAARLVDDVGRRLAWAVHLLVLAYDVPTVVVGGGVSRSGATFAGPILDGLDRLRAGSALSREVLHDDILEILPPDLEAGAWGAATIALRSWLS